MTDEHVMAEPGSVDAYIQLAEVFDSTHELPGRGGSKPLTYISGEQCITRLNETLGYDGWAFEVVADGITEDEAWCRGRLTFAAPTLPGGVGWREQYGSQKLKRLRSDQSLLDLGFDLKGAVTDALKKCASLIGVGLYLSHREEIDRATPPQQQGQAQQGPRTPAPAGRPAGPVEFTAEDEAVEDQAKQNHKPNDLAFLSWTGRVRQQTSEVNCRKLAEQIKADKEHNPQRAEIWTEARDLAIKHLMLDQARAIGFKFGDKPGNAVLTRTAPNPGAQSSPAA